MDTLKIVGIEKFSMVDFGERITCTLFIEGCNFRCPFCHNGSLVAGGAPEIPEETIFDYLIKRKGMVDAVCISGGEPTLQKGLDGFLAKIKALGYPVKLDTNGTSPAAIIRLHKAGLIDYIAMDIKNSPAGYAATAGVSISHIESIKESAHYLMTSGIDYEFRTTLVDGFHTEEDMAAISKWLAGAKRYYLQKFVDSDNCLQAGLAEVSLKKAQDYKRLLSEYIECVELRGY